MKKNETEKKALRKDQKEIRIYHVPVGKGSWRD